MENFKKESWQNTYSSQLKQTKTESHFLLKIKSSDDLKTIQD
jgi:hypothetical protein